MKFTTVKSAKDIGIPGVEFVIVDKAITEIVIGKVRIRKGESYSSALQVLVETPFETVERFRLTGKIDGFPDAVSYYESKYEAETAGNKLEDAGAKITVERVDVTIDDDGTVVGSGAPGNDNASDVPF
jgi:hypothetical protein